MTREEFSKMLAKHRKASGDKVMDITNEIVSENQLTTMMITHNIDAALKTGNRTIMLDQGEILFDIEENVRKEMTVTQLLESYKQKKNQALSNDRMLLQN